MAEALAEGADMVMTQGATESNHALRLLPLLQSWDLAAISFWKTAPGRTTPTTTAMATYFWTICMAPRPLNMRLASTCRRRWRKRLGKLAGAGRKVYIIPGGGSNRTGALGYVNCAFELVGQANDRGLALDHIVTATGSAGTQAGLVVGLQAINAEIPLLGFGVGAPQAKQEENVFALAQRRPPNLAAPMW